MFQLTLEIKKKKLPTTLQQEEPWCLMKAAHAVVLLSALPSEETDLRGAKSLKTQERPTCSHVFLFSILNTCFKLLNIYFYLCAGMSVCACVYRCPQKPDSSVHLELKLQAVVSHPMDAGNWVRPLQEQYTLVTTQPSLQPPCLILKHKIVSPILPPCPLTGGYTVMAEC